MGTHVICYNSNILSHLQPYDHHPGDDHLDDDHLVDIDKSESQYEKTEKHCRCLVVKILYHKHLIVTRLLTTVIQVVKIITRKQQKSEFNNYISTERQRQRVSRNCGIKF